MRQYLYAALVAAIIFPLYAFHGDAALSLDVGLFIGTMAALYFFELISLNSAVVAGVVMYVFYLLVGDDAFYLFSILFGLLFCLIGLYALVQLFQPVKGRGKLLALLALVAPIAMGFGAYLVWVGATELGLWAQLGRSHVS
jgi:hypothetical protein